MQPLHQYLKNTTQHARWEFKVSILKKYSIWEIVNRENYALTLDWYLVYSGSFGGPLRAAAKPNKWFIAMFPE